ncbi:hypothetical protein ADL21_02360 [Streptomyces albus subsp. albus]|nr:hypothetical protein ADL21_02360 [Streptomyces albus subsp. albus]
MVWVLDTSGQPTLGKVLEPVPMETSALTARQLVIHLQHEGITPTDFEFCTTVATARQAVLTGDADSHLEYTADLAAVLDVADSPRQCEAVSTAVLDPWVATVSQLTVNEALARLRREVRALHTQLQPLWERRSGGRRTMLLDQPLPSGLSLYEALADRTAGVDGVALPWEPENARTAEVFALLDDAEREVARCWAMQRGASWEEAALGAGLPATFGERVRRKLRRLGRGREGC